MREADFFSRLKLLRRAFTDGPIAELSDLQREAGVGSLVLKPSYNGPVKDDLRRQIAHGAAKLLKLNPQEVEAWLCGVQDAAGGKTWPDVPGVDEYVRWLPTQVACTLCHKLFDKGSKLYTPALRRCKPCQRALRNPGTAKYEEALAAQLPAIKQKCPAVGKAVEQTLAANEAVTYARISQRSSLPIPTVATLFKGMGLDKRTFLLWWWLVVQSLTGSQALSSPLPPCDSAPPSQSESSPSRTPTGRGNKKRCKKGRSGTRAEAA